MAGIVLGIVAILGTWFVRQYVGDMRVRRDEIDALPTKRAANCWGLEYLERGSGESVLVVHGIWGGVDQGLVNAAGVVDGSYHGIFVSRFGYLGSAMPEYATPALQADAFACLLDELGIDRAVLFAHSAGSTSAIQFALRHGEKAKALVLVSPNAPGEVDVGLPPRWLAERLFRVDFLFWFLAKYGAAMLHRMMGVPAGYRISVEDTPLVNALAASVLPVSRRYLGTLFDMFVSNPSVQNLRLEEITAPTLVVAARDDPLSLYANSQRMAERITGAELLTVESGGHMLLGSQDNVDQRITAFLEEHAG